MTAANLTNSIEPFEDSVVNYPPPPPPPPPTSHQHHVTSIQNSNHPVNPSENHSIHRLSPNGSQTYSFHRKYGPRKKSFIGFDAIMLVIVTFVIVNSMLFSPTAYLVSADLVEDTRLCAIMLTFISLALIAVSLPFSLFFCIKVVQEYERAVIFRLGRLVTGGARGPGIFFIIPCIDTYSKVDLRTVSFDVPPQEILSKDSVTVAVDAVVYFRINNAIASVSNVEDYARSTRLLAATTLRNVLGTKNLSEILSERESISHMIQSSLDEATESWGVKVERVEIKDVRLPVLLQRAMAAEAEATREARAKVIAAEGEQRASKALKEAAEVIADSPAALQLRYLQTLSSIAAENNSTIVFPVPMELFRGFIVQNNNANNNNNSNHTNNQANQQQGIKQLIEISPKE
ncbi:band 7 protein AGAP004871-like isoform X1 [Panonychus citri]|uniref:band 7 protein AGAP004871-like isoform X1 n=1 Tax=Panonychus citri TaxID=50023 RepID=UPI00230824FD|nr:band 7 protein AGAP004871-like isoform X1 [Panonychus citri]